MRLYEAGLKNQREHLLNQLDKNKQVLFYEQVDILKARAYRRAFWSTTIMFFLAVLIGLLMMYYFNDVGAKSDSERVVASVLILLILMPVYYLVDAYPRAKLEEEVKLLNQLLSKKP
ncbi:TPA: hypothetical protein ACGOVD_001220 [Streptococcus suis]